MDQRVRARDLFELTVESFEVDGSPRTSSILRVFVDPPILLQFLAFNTGAAHSGDGRSLVCTDWHAIPPDVLQEIRMTLFTSYDSFLRGELQPDKNGHHVFESMGAEAIVEEPGHIVLKDPEGHQRKKVKRWRFP